MVVHVCATHSVEEIAMALRFLGIWPNTPNDGSPTIWLDEGSGDLIIQSWKADDATLMQCKEVGSIPGHTTDVPDHEAVIRLPANMIQFLPKPGSEDNGGNGGS
jgi:hypothetical protein